MKLFKKIKLYLKLKKNKNLNVIFNKKQTLGIYVTCKVFNYQDYLYYLNSLKEATK